MASFHRNNYVIQIESLGDCKCVRLISTRECMQVLAHELSSALKNEASLRADYLKKISSELGFAIERKPDFSLTLWDQWATVAFEQTDRVRLCFLLEADLGPYYRFQGVYRGFSTPPLETSRDSSASTLEAKGDYVFKVDRGKGWIYHTVVLTRKLLDMLQHELSQALEKPEELLRTKSLKPEDPTLLWEGEAWALIDRKRPGPVKLSFELVPDLDRYHDQSWAKRRKRLDRLCSSLVVVVLLAGFGYLFWVSSASRSVLVIILTVIVLVFLDKLGSKLKSYLESKR